MSPITMLYHLVLLGILILSECWANTEVTLDNMTCLFRRSYQVNKSGVKITWTGAKIQNCKVRLKQEADSIERMCLEILQFDIPECSVNIEYTVTGSIEQFGSCNSPNTKLCLAAHTVTLIINANTTNDAHFVLQAVSESSMLATSAPLESNGKSNHTMIYPVKSGMPLWAVIAMICGVFIPIIIIVVVVAIVCIRRQDKPLSDSKYQTPLKETSDVTANGSHDIIESSTTPINRSTIIEDDEDSPSDACVRLSVNV